MGFDYQDAAARWWHGGPVPAKASLSYRPEMKRPGSELPNDSRMLSGLIGSLLIGNPDKNAGLQNTDSQAVGFFSGMFEVNQQLAAASLHGRSAVPSRFAQNFYDSCPNAGMLRRQIR